MTTTEQRTKILNDYWTALQKYISPTSEDDKRIILTIIETACLSYSIESMDRAIKQMIGAFRVDAPKE